MATTTSAPASAPRKATRLLGRSHGRFQFTYSISRVARSAGHGHVERRITSFATNGRLLLSETAVNGREFLPRRRPDGRVRTRLSGPSGDIRQPTWGPFLSNSYQVNRSHYENDAVIPRALAAPLSFYAGRFLRSTSMNNLPRRSLTLRRAREPRPGRIRAQSPQSTHRQAKGWIRSMIQTIRYRSAACSSISTVSW